MSLFDSYLFIDWSASNRRLPEAPSANAPWVGEYTTAEKFQEETYHRTRQAAFDYVLGRLLHHIEFNRRILVGFDFPYGYPHNFARVLKLSNEKAAWWNVWAELSSRLLDHDNNVNNRFSVASDLNCIISDGGQGPFWGCPQNQATPYLTTTSPGFPFETANDLKLERLRVCESRLNGVQEAWKLFGAGSVGSQTITGLPRVNRLRRHPQLANFSKVWPFETWFSPKPSPERGPFILHAEIWPGVVDHEVQEILAENFDLVQDQAQVRAMCKWASHLDQNNEFGELFNVPSGMDLHRIEQCIQEEGWILGAQ